MNTHNEVCTILSAGGVPVQPDDMLEMMEVVKQKTQRLSLALDKALDKGHVSQADLGKSGLRREMVATACSYCCS